jgi:chromosome segregation ATPase
VLLLTILILLTSGGLGYYSYQLNLRIEERMEEMKTGFEGTFASQNEILQGIGQRLDQGDERYASLQGEFAVTRERLGLTRNELQRARQISSELADQQKSSAELLTNQLDQLQEEQVSTKGSVGTLTVDVDEVKEDVKSTQDLLASTQTELQRVKGDLGVQSDLIAHNAQELDSLRELGERAYFEFDLRKTRRPQRVGQIALQLRKTDVKRQKYTIHLVADDRTIEKKDKTVHEPVQFYRPGDGLPTEIVVNQIFKDRIVGYVSAPKVAGPSRTPMETTS